MKNPNNNNTEPPARRSRYTSWEPVEKWYNKSVGDEGHYYHKQLVIPGVIRLLAFDSSPASLLDMGCGQGILAKSIPKQVEYLGVDVSPSLIKAAKSDDHQANHHYLVADALKPLIFKRSDFSHAAIVLAIQNFQHPEQALENITRHLRPQGRLVIAMNHPCFRIPRQSSWKIDEQNQIQYRRIDRYSSSMDIPIQAHPSQGEQSVTTWSFHRPLAEYSRWLFEAGFAIELIEEWHSDKVSTGKSAKMENRSRQEIPMFLAIRAIKLSKPS
ncbi:MAG: class I SAM-dependent methyltransferase [Parachlamydiaceae bacterium]